MHLESIKKELPIQCGKNLQALHEMTCQEYVRRLCRLWGVPTEEAWWVSELVGGELHIADAPFSLDMVELRYIVDNGVGFDGYMEYWDFVECELGKGLERPRINFGSWFRLGARPESIGLT